MSKSNIFGDVFATLDLDTLFENDQEGKLPSGTTLDIQDSSGASLISLAEADGAVNIGGDGKIEWQHQSAAGNSILESRVEGDAYPRVKIQANGAIYWGSGAAAADVILYRSGADTLATDNKFLANYGWLAVYRGNTGDSAITTNNAGSSVVRLNILVDGTLKWSSGAAAADCILSRRAANILNTPDRLEVGTLGVGNSAAATTLGSVVKKIEVFDAAGASLGYLPVYDAIT